MAETFRNGKKYVDGREINPRFLYEALSSNGMTVYTAVLWEDGKASCNCTGWATSKKSPKECKHSRVALGLTDNRLISREASPHLPPPAYQPTGRTGRIVE